MTNDYVYSLNERNRPVKKRGYQADEKVLLLLLTNGFSRARSGTDENSVSLCVCVCNV